MEKIAMTLGLADGGSLELTGPFSALLTRTLESPAQSLEAVFPLERGTAPSPAVTVTLSRGSRRIFAGWCDQQTAREDGDGRTLEIQARSRGGLLLDNEALPQTYYNVSTRDIFREHLVPYGFSPSALEIPRDYTAGVFTVAKGMSHWEVFYAFCVRMYALFPRVTTGERVVVAELPAAPAARITNRPGREGLRYLSAEDTVRRASVISEIILRDKKGNYSRSLGNPWGNPWRVVRRRYVIPGAEYATVPTADAWERFRQAQHGARTAEALLPGWAELSPGDRVTLETGLGPAKDMTVWQSRWEWSDRGEYTRLTLAE